jgi:hypothetical protein
MVPARVPSLLLWHHPPPIMVPTAGEFTDNVNSVCSFHADSMSFGILFSRIHTFHFPTIVSKKWITGCVNMVHACASSFGGGSHPYCYWTWCKLIWLWRTSRAIEPAKVDLHPHWRGLYQCLLYSTWCVNYFLIPTHKCEKLDNTKWEIGIEISTLELIIHHGLPIKIIVFFTSVFEDHSMSWRVVSWHMVS